MEEKKTRRNTDLVQLQTQERFVPDTFCAAFREFLDYRGRVFCAQLLQSHKQCWHLLALVNPASVGQQVLAVAFLTSVDSLLCPSSHSHCLLLLTVSFSRQLSQAVWSLQPSFVNYSLSLSLSLFSRTFLPSTTSGLTGDLDLRPFVWVSRQNRQRDRLSGANTNRNELLHIVSQCDIALLSYLPPTPLRQDMFFKRSLTGWN